MDKLGSHKGKAVRQASIAAKPRWKAARQWIPEAAAM
jgi:hypothetical protein